MNDTLLTIAHAAQAEFTEKKSRFIGYAEPCATEEEAAAFIAEIKKRHNDATHNVYAYQIGKDNELQRSNDDGEPAGTAGRPILEIIKRLNLSNTVIVVTRYFGGTLLGTGGLVRAYSQAAQMAIEAAGVVKLMPAVLYNLHFAYPHLSAVQKLLNDYNAKTDNVGYGEEILMTCRIAQASEPEFLDKLNAIGNGAVGKIEIDRDLFISASPQNKR